MTKADDEIEVKNKCDVVLIGPESRIYHHQFIFVTVVPKTVFEKKPSDKFQVSRLGQVHGFLTRNEIYEDLT